MPSLTPPQASRLLSSFSSFLTIAIHSILYHRGLYPAESFLTARAYNLPVHQSRHPGVCTWIRDAVAAVVEQIRLGTAHAIALVVHAPTSLNVLERWVFDISAFPSSSWGNMAALAPEPEHNMFNSKNAAMADDVRAGPSSVGRVAGASADADGDAINWTDVHEALRGALRRIAYAGEKKPALVEGCTFTIAVELRDEAEAPIGHPQPWIPTEPHLQPPTSSNPSQGSARGGQATTPIRSVQAGPLFFECWLEEGKTPAASQGSAKTTNTTSS